MTTLLIVCTGNLCRSPMAETLLRARLAQDPDREDWQVISAGTWASDGELASTHAVTAMAERGLDLNHHQSRQVTEALVQEADLILGMTPHHVEALRLSFPDAEDRICLLASMAGESHGVTDPYGSSLTEYRATANELDRLIERGYERIVALAERPT